MRRIEAKRVGPLVCGVTHKAFAYMRSAYVWCNRVKLSQLKLHALINCAEAERKARLYLQTFDGAVAQPPKILEQVNVLAFQRKIVRIELRSRAVVGGA